MSQPTHPPPPTPGAIRVHRPPFSESIDPTNGRYHPYNARSTTPATPGPLGLHNENCPPNAQARSFSPSPFTAGSAPYQAETTRASTGLRRWSSISNLGDTFSNGFNDEPMFSEETRTLPDALLSKTNRLLEQFNLWVEKDKVYNFVELSSQDRELVMYLTVLKLQNQTESQTLLFEEFRTQVLELKKYVSGNWTPSKAQQELLDQLIGHWLIKPLASYDKIYDRVKNFVHLRAEWLHLGVYVTDPVARFVIDQHLQKTAGEKKGTFRKEIIASIKESKPLEDFARVMLNKYHCPVVPSETPRDTLASLAFLRSLAAESQSPSNDQTKYWRRVEVVLADLYNVNGQKRDTDPRWKAWEDKLIATDQAKYSCNVPGTHLTLATSRDVLAASNADQQALVSQSLAEEMDALVNAPVEPDAVRPLFSLYKASAIPVNIPAHAMDGNVELHTLGDVASTIENSL